MPRKTNLTIKLPAELLDLCKRDGTTPETVVRGFIADLCRIYNDAETPRTDGYCTNGSDERDLAQQYYYRVGYPFLNG